MSIKDRVSDVDIGTAIGSSDVDHRRDNLVGYLFILPNIIVFTAFSFGPVVFALVISFTDWNLLSADPNWVGVDNYVDQLTPAPWTDNWAPLRDPNANLWWFAVKNTAVYTIGVVPLTIFGGLAIALLLDGDIRGKKWYRAAYFMPLMIAGAISAVIWNWALELDGMVNTFLEPMGLAYNWAGSPDTALFSIMLIGVWGGIGFNMIIFLAGLQNIPDELYEAARMDGTNGWQRFRHVTWPSLQDTYFFVMVMAIIGSFQVFGVAYVFGEGGPYYSTTVVSILIYEEAFSYQRMGSAAAMAFMLFAIIFAFSYWQYRKRGRNEVL